MPMERVVSIQGPIEKIDGKMVLCIPLAAGGDALANCAKGIGQIEGDLLKVVIPDWLAEKIGISEGTIVNVHNRDGKFNIVPESKE